MTDSLYDELGLGYDTVIDWPERFGREAPFFRDLFDRYRVETVLDTACGTGEHVALFASWGLAVAGADISEAMLGACRRKYPALDVQWIHAGFGETSAKAGRVFDAVTCLGNSFPHVLTDAEAAETMRDFAALLRPGAVLVIQQLNYQPMFARNERFMGPQGRCTEAGEQFYLRIFDLDRRPIRFTMVEMTREGDRWSRREWETLHRPWTAAEMEGLLGAAGFTELQLAGDFTGGRFSASESDQMIVVAVRGR